MVVSWQDVSCKELTVTALGEYISDAMRGLSWEQKDLVAASGLTKATISRIVSGVTKQPDRKTLAQLARALHKPLGALLERAGYVLDEEIARDPGLAELWTLTLSAHSDPERATLLRRVLEMSDDPVLRARISGYLDGLE